VNNVREPMPGEILAQNYLLERELGRGGFGVVFLARHLDIERSVAIKVLLATYAAKDPTAKERFRREAKIAASLGYPNSLRVFDYGETDEGVFYIVMEFLAGRDLGKVLETEPRIPVRRAIHIIRQVLHALMEAHAHGIVHRDIKPDNIMLASLDYDPDFVKVMDFGIAKMVEGGEQITSAGITLGTPRYMPIEQLKGAHLEPSTDLYAVGLVLYEMLVGRPAFSGETAVDTAVAVMEGGSVTVPEDANVPEPLRRIIAKASARHAEDRYRDARSFLEALNGLDPSMLDVDPIDIEQFNSGQQPPTRRPVTSEMRLESDAKPARGKDFEDVVATQAVSTAEVLAALPPRARLSQQQRKAPTDALDVAALDAATVAATDAGHAGPAASRADATETSMVAAYQAGPTAGVAAFSASAAGKPIVSPLMMFALDAAILVVVLIILARVL